MGTLKHELLPSRFINSSQRRTGRARRALRNGDGPAARLYASVTALYLYSLHAEHLALPQMLTAPKMIYVHDAVRSWREAVRHHLRPPYYYRLEVGREHRLHVHVLANRDAGLLHLPRDRELIKPVYDLEGMLKYLAKPPVPLSDEALVEYQNAVKRASESGRRLPNLSGFVGVPRLALWNSETCV